MYTILISESFLLEGIEHVRNLYKSWAQNKSGNPEAAMAIMDDVLKYQQMLPKKDFAEYSSYDELKRDYDQILLKLQQKEISSDVEKIYEDKDLLVIVPKTWQASCKYGASTKWCTASKQSSSDWDEYHSKGLETFWSYKNLPDSNPDHKWSHFMAFKREHQKEEWCDAVDNCYPDFIDVLPKRHPKYQQILNKIVEKYNIVKKDKLTALGIYQTIECVFNMFMYEENVRYDRNFYPYLWQSMDKYMNSLIGELRKSFTSFLDLELRIGRHPINFFFDDKMRNRFESNYSYFVSKINESKTINQIIKTDEFQLAGIRMRILDIFKIKSLFVDLHILKELMTPILNDLNIKPDVDNSDQIMVKVRENKSRIVNSENFNKLLSYVVTANIKEADENEKIAIHRMCFLILQLLGD